jgi:hypothetical protein
METKGDKKCEERKRSYTRTHYVNLNSKHLAKEALEQFGDSDIGGQEI